MKKKHFKSIFISSILVASSVYTLSAQNILETRWYFGNSSSNLIFDQNGRDVYLQDDQATSFGSVGSLTISDQLTGNLLFYSDGETVYDGSHTIVPSGVSLNGNTLVNVPIVACPVVGIPGQYYLFTNSGSAAPNEIQYTVVDANLSGNGTVQFPYGDVDIGQTNIATSLIDPSEGMIMIPTGDGEVFWLITQNRTTFDINVTQIDNGGVGASTPYSFVRGATPGFEASHFAFNADSSQLVMASRTANRNLWLMNFDVNSGVLSFDRTLAGTGFDDGLGESIYDVEWSPDGSKLYFSRFGSTGVEGQVYQIDFNDSLEVVNQVLPSQVFRSYGLQRAIDGRIYHLYQESNATSPFLIGRINRPDSIADSVNYEPMLFTEDFSAQQFPSFTPGYNFVFSSLRFYWVDSCETNTTKFFPIVDPVPNSISWDFGDGGQSENWIPNYTYMAAGGYMVSLTAEVGGVTQTITQPVEILTNDLTVDLGNDTTICIDEVLTLDAGTGTSFLWSTGETTQTIDVDTTGTYWVEVTTTNGCTDFDDIEVLEYGVVEQIFNQWYFGEQAGIDFNNGPIAILDGNNQYAEEGCATLSDVNGDLLFYTNGVTIWNREHDIMVNGDSIGGDLQSAQNALIMPFSDDQTLFYVFTTEQVYGDNTYSLRYSIVDMKGDTSLGAVIIKNIKLMDNGTERITGSGFTGNDVIVTHELGNNTFRSFTTSEQGLSGAIFSPTGEVHDFMNEQSASGYMKISPTYNVLAVNIPGTNQIEILDFDRGEVSNPRLIDTGETDLYGLEFSASGNRLYATTSSSTSKLIQYDLDSLDSANPAADIQATKFDGYPQSANSSYGAIQIAPTGQVYIAVDNSTTLGVISAPDGDDDANGFQPAGFDLQGRTSRLGLPNFSQIENSPFQEPVITVTPGCVGQASEFIAVGRDPLNSIENYLWIFGDGTSAAIQDTTHIYTSPGTYTVQMVLSNRCDVDTTLSTTIVINNIPESPTVPSDTALCDQSIVLEAWPIDNSDFSYYWSTNDTTRQITVTDPNIINVAIINNTTGCTSDTLSVFLADARPQVALGNDQILCQNDPAITLDAQVVNVTSYTWAINGVSSGSNRTVNVDTSVPGNFEYTIEVINSFGCINSDTLQVTIQEEPDILVTPNNTSGCANDDGSVDIAFNSSGSYSYAFSGPTNVPTQSFDGPGSVSQPNLAPGNYSLAVTNLVTGCTRLEVVQIEDIGGFGLSVSSNGICNNQVDLILTSLPANYNYEVLDDQGLIIASGSETSDPFTIPNLNPDTYSVQVTDNNPPACVETEQETIIAGGEPNFTFNAIQEFCSTTGVVTVADGGTAGVSYTWATTGGNIVTNPATGVAIEVNRSGTYEVTAQATGFCDRVETVEVIFNAEPTAEVITSGDPCEGQVILLANIAGGSGSYIYTWSDGSQAAQNTVTTSETYSVTIFDQYTGCSATSTDLEVAVETEFMVNLSLEPDCKNNEQVFLVATTNYFDPSITYQWADGSGNILTDTDSVLVVTNSDTYVVTATNESRTCMAMESLTVALVPINPEELILPERATFCPIDPNDPTVTLNPGIFNTYEWTLSPDLAVISTDQTVSVSTAGNYEVVLYNGFTCLTDQVQVLEDCRPVIIAPNAFSPNGNAVNETFFVFPNDYIQQFEILIYNRWGELIYRAENINFQWNGVYKGKVLPPGTYAYIMKFSSSLDSGAETFEQFGSITLLR